MPYIGSHTFAYYLTSVRLWISDLTNGVIDLNDLPDEYDLGEAYADEIPAKEAAQELLEAAGYYSFSFPEDADCGYDCDGRPIGG